LRNFILKNNKITLYDINHIVCNNLQIKLDNNLIRKVKKSRLFLENKISKTDDVIYGVNTGFGDLHNMKIEKKN
jgi:histidine ammonia-lyase